MTDAMNKQSRVEFDRIEVGVLGNCREKLTRIDELAADIRENGLLQPLLVWHKRMRREPHVLPDGREVWDRYILIAGNRRHAAIAKIRDDEPGAFEAVAVTLKTGNEDDALFAQIAENLQREDLTPVELANAVYKMRQRGHTQAAIAGKLSKSQGWVSRLLKLRERATSELLKAVGDGEVPLETALALCELDDKEQLKALARFREKRNATGSRDANRDARTNAGRPQRRTAAEVRSYTELLARSAPKASATDPRRVAHVVLLWLQGAEQWPGFLPRPEDEAGNDAA
ncbi:MAG: ParB/RepB/Spo0J family partition protein [Deltaproteobacteria bacterium]|nr:ParB/RepB/Spo0J family partition protein [Deltaproteobacteria bacterium]